VFEPGHRVRLDLASSDWPNAWPPPRPGSLLVDRERSRLTLPTLQGPAPDERLPELPPPRPGPPGQTSDAGAVTWRIEHDVTGRQTRAVVRYGGETEADEVAPPVVQRYEGMVGVSTDDPGRAFADARATYELRFPEARVQTASALRIDSDADAYQVRIDLEAREGDEVFWSRRWERRIPRNLQ
jgi:hypothetical protein